MSLPGADDQIPTTDFGWIVATAEVIMFMISPFISLGIGVFGLLVITTSKTKPKYPLTPHASFLPLTPHASFLVFVLMIIIGIIGGYLMIKKIAEIDVEIESETNKEDE